MDLIDTLKAKKIQRILITAANTTAQTFAEQCRSVGITALLEPAIAVHALPKSAYGVLHEAWSNAEIHLFMSPVAVHFAREPLAAVDRPASAHCFAVGAVTAQALSEYGLNADFPTPQNHQGLLAMPALAAVVGKRVAVYAGVADPLDPFAYTQTSLQGDPHAVGAVVQQVSAQTEPDVVGMEPVRCIAGAFECPALAEPVRNALQATRVRTGSEKVVETLSARGADAVFVPCYQRSLPFAPAPCLLDPGHYADAVYLSSAEALRYLIHLHGTLERIARVPLLVISERIAYYAKKWGLTDVTVVGELNE